MTYKERKYKRKEHTCDICGKTFTVYMNGAGRIYCSLDCQEVARKEKQRENYEQTKEHRKTLRKSNEDEKKEQKDKRSGIEKIIEIDRKARAEGLSYGQYVLKLEMEREKKARENKRIMRQWGEA